jgi:transposase
MDVAQFKQDVISERITVDQLIELIVALERKLQAANQRIEQLERQQGTPPPPKISEPFSVAAEERRQEARGKKRRKPKRESRGGRTASAEKIAQAERTEKLFPAGVPAADCWLSHTRPVWRLENGRAVRVAYEIYNSM